MQYVVWGTGYIAREYMNKCSKNIHFFLDNDVCKRGKTFYGKKIVYPDDIKSWSNMHIIVAVNILEPIVKQLQMYGLRKDVDYSLYYENLPLDNFDNAEYELNEKIEEIIKQKEWREEIVCLGATFRNEYRVNEYFNMWQEVLKTRKFIYILEVGSEIINDNLTKKNYWSLLPAMFSEYVYPRYSEVCKIKEEAVQFVMDCEELRLAANCWKEKHSNAQPGYEFGVIYYFFIYIKKVIDILRPKGMMIWNKFSAYHRVAEYLCKLKAIPIIYCEYGLLPGTLVFERMGQMGESAPSVYAEEFLELSISREEFERADDVWKHIKNKNLNRKKQWAGIELHELKEKIDYNKKTVFFAGQNDVVAGLYPYTERARKYHSPIFQSSIQAAVFLAELADKNGWNFIFKPHPSLPITNDEMMEMPNNIIFVNNIGVNYLIDLADVTVTIVSQTAYMALLRDKPTLLLGYLQLKDKKCTYQAFSKEEIENELCRAIRYGFTDEQKEYFQKHIAQLLKYYLYDDYDTKRSYRYGKSFPTNFSEIWQLEQRLKEMRREKNNDNG